MDWRSVTKGVFEAENISADARVCAPFDGRGLANWRTPIIKGSSKHMKSSPVADSLLELIRSRRAKTGVIGLGYVGLPLAVEFARAGFVTTGIDLDPEKVEAINQGASYIPDVPTAEVARLVAEGRLIATCDFTVVKELDT